MTGRVLLSRVRDSFLALLVLTILASNFSSHVYAADTGLLNAGTGADVPHGDTAWSDPGNITVSGIPYATVNLSHGDDSHYLRGTNFGFSIPDDATIDGITVTIRRSGDQSFGYGVEDHHIHLVKNGVIQTSGDDKADTNSNWPTTLAARSYGSTSDKWRLSWSAADINNVNFGVALCARNNSPFSTHIGSVDYIQVTVTYTSNLNATTTTVSSSINPSTYNQSVSFTADVTPPEATGTVQFTNRRHRL